MPLIVLSLLCSYSFTADSTSVLVAHVPCVYPLYLCRLRPKTKTNASLPWGSKTCEVIEGGKVREPANGVARSDMGAAGLVAVVVFVRGSVDAQYKSTGLPSAFTEHYRPVPPPSPPLEPVAS